MVTTTPAPEDADWFPKRDWPKRHKASLAQRDLLFVGDSITEGWLTEGRATWDREYVPLNLGIGGGGRGHAGGLPAGANGDPQFINCPASPLGGPLPYVEAMRSEIRRLLRAAPFRRFVLTMESGERALIEHPENVAYDPEDGGSDEFYIVTGKLRLVSTFDHVTGVLFANRGQDVV